MAKITMKGKAVNTKGDLPKNGTTAPEFKLVRTDLNEVSLQTYSGKRKVLNIFPSLDTSTCAMSVRTFNKAATDLRNTVVLNISADLPFAQQRFCGAEGIKNADTLSTFRSSFPDDYNVRITDSVLAGVCSRAVIVLDENNKVLYTEQVSEIGNEPNYEQALAYLR